MFEGEGTGGERENVGFICGGDDGALREQGRSFRRLLLGDHCVVKCGNVIIIREGS